MGSDGEISTALKAAAGSKSGFTNDDATFMHSDNSREGVRPLSAPQRAEEQQHTYGSCWT